MAVLPSSLRATVLNLALSLGTIAVCAGGAEGLCRLLEARHAPAVAAYITDWAIWDGDFYTVDSTAAGWPPLEDYNADGLRDRTHSVEKPAGVERLVVLGDSVTAGYRIRPEEAYPQVLQDRLDALAGTRVEVFNVALGGWSTRQERIAYGRLARKYRPDHVLVGVCLNDIPELGNNLGRPARWMAGLHRRSALVRRIVGAAEREIRSIEELVLHPESERVRQAYDRFFAELLALRAEVQEDRASFAVLVFPFEFQMAPDGPAPVPQKAIAAFCAREGIPCLDLLPALRRTGPAAFVDYDHFTRAGSEVVAEEILASRIVPALGTPRAGEQMDSDLASRLRDPDPAVRAASAWAIGRGTHRLSHVPALAAALRDGDPRARAGAAWTLGRMGPLARAAAPDLIRALRDRDAEVGRRAADALGGLGLDHTFVPALVAVLGDRAAPARAVAAQALAALGPVAADAVDALVLALDAPEEAVRREALAALRATGAAGRAAVPALLRAFEDPALRWRVPDVLGAMGPAAREAVPALTAALDDPSGTVRWRAAKALGRIGPAAASAAWPLVRLTRDPQGNVRAAALTALARVDADPHLSLPPLSAALADRDGEVRRTASDALGAMGPAARDAVPGLVALLQDPDMWVRSAAARALGRTARGSEKAAAALKHLLQDGEPAVRAEAARALKRLSAQRRASTR